MGFYQRLQKNPRSFGTHDGVFHADEVTAAGLLMLFDKIDRNKICRTRDLELLATCEFVCDVGGYYDVSKKNFDHHQVEYQGELSSAGMILKYLRGEDIITEKDFEFFNDTLIRGVDLQDNGKHQQLKGYCFFSDVVDHFNPIFYNVTDPMRDQAFHHALDFVYGYLKRSWDRHQYVLSCRKIVESRMNTSKTCLIFDEAIPWIESFFELGGENHPAIFIVMPSGKHWKLRGIPPSYDDRMAVRVPLPEEWAGRLDQDLKKISGIKGAMFCHKQRFISVWETKQDALQALEYVMKEKV